MELIRQLIPLGLAEVDRMLEEEVEQLAGQRHARKTEDDRHYGMGITQGRCGWAASGIRCEYRGCEVGRRVEAGGV